MSLVYGTIDQQLAAIGRLRDPVIDNGNCLFESVSRQLEDLSFTAHYLRVLVYQAGKNTPERYEHLVQDDRTVFQAQMKSIKEDEFRSAESDVLILSILQQELDKKIVLIRHGFKPMHIPDTDPSLGPECIVVIARPGDIPGFTHFDATALKPRGLAYFVFYWLNLAAIVG